MIAAYDAVPTSSRPFRVTLSLGYPDSWPADYFGFEAVDDLRRMIAPVPPLPYCIDAKRLEATLRQSGWQLDRVVHSNAKNAVAFTKLWGDREAKLQIYFPSSQEWAVPDQCVLSVHINPGKVYLP